MPYTTADADKTLAPWEFGSWMLENFATVDELKANLNKGRRSRRRARALGLRSRGPLHRERRVGQSPVIKFVGGKLNVYDAPLGVITNSPTFDWQMTNLRNYVNLSMTSAAPINVRPIALKPTGQGSGMLGMPGDFTPLSRFVRAVAFSQSVLPFETGNDASSRPSTS